LTKTTRTMRAATHGAKDIARMDRGQQWVKGRHISTVVTAKHCNKSGGTLAPRGGIYI